MTPTIHGTVLRMGHQGVLIRGPVGSGKSDLALRLMDQPGFGIGLLVCKAELVADDRVMLDVANDKLMAQAPPTLQGLMEVRGIGIFSVNHVPCVQVTCVVDLAETAIDRMPDALQQTTEIKGVTLPRLVLRPFEASAPAKIRAFLNQLPTIGE